MTDKRIERINTKILDPSLVKYVAHCFCAAVIYECEQMKTNDLNKGISTVIQNVIKCSYEGQSACSIKPVTYVDDLLACLFNQKNNVPAYVYFWFNTYYFDIFGEATEYKNKHNLIYNKLQHIYVEHYRKLKADDIDDERYYKQQRRKICKLFRSGEYSATFSLANMSFDDFMDKKEIETLSEMLSELFIIQFSSFEKAEDERAAAYILGRIQGERAAAEKYEKNGRASRYEK